MNLIDIFVDIKNHIKKNVYLPVFTTFIAVLMTILDQLWPLKNCM